MFIPQVIDVEFQGNGWLIWLPGDFWEPYYGAYWIYSDEHSI